MDYSNHQANVLHIYSSVNAGGGMLFVQSILLAMQADGASPHIAMRPNSALAERLSSTTPQALRLASAQRHALPLHNSLDVYSLWQLARIIRRENIQIIHAHTGRDYAMAVLLAKLMRRKCVLHRHYFRVSRNPVTKFFFRKSDFVITVNQQLREQYIHHVGLDAKRVASLPNWYERPPSSRRHTLTQRECRVISMAGNINANKGQHVFVAAAQQVLATHPDCVFHMIGLNDHSASSEYYHSLVERISAAGLQEKILFQPWQNDIAAYYDNSDIWVVPSHQEAFGRVAIEAMWHEVPLIVSNVGGLQEIVADGVTACVVEPGDEQHLAKTIQLLLDDSEQCERMAQKALLSAQQRYSKGIVLQKIHAIYQQILA